MKRRILTIEYQVPDFVDEDPISLDYIKDEWRLLRKMHTVFRDRIKPLIEFGTARQIRNILCERIYNSLQFYDLLGDTRFLVERILLERYLRNGITKGDMHHSPLDAPEYQH